MAPPRVGMVEEVRMTKWTGIQAGHQTGMPAAPMLRMNSQTTAISSSRPGRASLISSIGGRLSITESW